MRRSGSTAIDPLVPAAEFDWQHTAKGVATLAAMALIGAMAMLGALSLAAGPAGAPFLPAYLQSLCRSLGGVPSPDEAPFLKDNETAMTTMMKAMDIAPSGNVDRDFVAMMVPHHQAAIDMAVAVLRHGKNERLRRLAQEIIVTQQQEIAAMRLAIGEPLPASIASPTYPQASASGSPATRGDLK
jgi:hypothetical protein